MRGSLNKPQLKRLSKCRQRTPAGLPIGIPGSGEVIDGAIQQAPQLVRHSTPWSARSKARIHGQ
ncbi:MAG TPA: hypothetical protein DDZ32_10270 [Gammaproteobacteria bacterium]|nr:hypothetical protein [Gammaproteobacteria bacterium]